MRTPTRPTVAATAGVARRRIAEAAAMLCLVTMAGCGGADDGSDGNPGREDTSSNSGDGEGQETDLVSSATENLLLGDRPDAWSPTLAAAHVDGTIYVYGRDDESILTATWSPEFDTGTFSSEGDPTFAVGTAADGTPLAVAATSGEEQSEGALSTNAEVTLVQVYDLRAGSLVGEVSLEDSLLNLPSEGGFSGAVAVTVIAEDLSFGLTAIDVSDPAGTPEVAWERPADHVVQIGDKLVVDGNLTDAATGTEDLGPTTIAAPTSNPDWVIAWEGDHRSVVNIETGETISRDLASDVVDATDVEVMVDPVSDLAVFVAPLLVEGEVTQIEVVDLSTGETIDETTVSAERATDLGFVFRGVNDGRLWVTSKQTDPVLDARTGETLADDWRGWESYTGGVPVLSGAGWAQMDDDGTSYMLENNDNYLVAYTGVLKP